jgi:hypothetical protein
MPIKQRRIKRLRQPPMTTRPRPFSAEDENRFVAELDRLLAQLAKIEVLKHLQGDQNGP